MQSISAFDHALILVGDLDAADATMQRLGFRPTPRGVHSAHMGTANSTIMLSNMTYFEVIGVVSPTPVNADMREMLERGPGLLGYAVKTDDAEATFRELEAVSADDGEIINFSREVDLPDGPRDAAFSAVDIARTHSLGIRMFACTHHTPDVVWRPDYLEQPNGTVGVEALFGAAPDIEAAGATLRALYGDRVSVNAEEVTIQYDNVSVGFLSPGALEARFGLAAFDEPALHVLRLRTRSLDRVRDSLSERAVACETTTEGTVRVAPQEACGAMIEFVSD